MRGHEGVGPLQAARVGGPPGPPGRAPEHPHAAAGAHDLGARLRGRSARVTAMERPDTEGLPTPRPGDAEPEDVPTAEEAPAPFETPAEEPPPAEEPRTEVHDPGAVEGGETVG